MPARFIESSALVKRWIAERGSAHVRQLTGPASSAPCFVSRFVVAEVAGALTRARRGGRLTHAEHAAALAELRADLAGRFDAVVLTSEILDRAIALAAEHGLGGADAVHLATACALQDALANAADALLEFVSADVELLAVAPHYGLRVVNPVDHALPSE